MKFSQALNVYPMILTECAISERLRRRSDVQLHQTLFNTPLIYNDLGRQHLYSIYLEYRNIALEAELPILLCAPTWKIDKQRIAASEYETSIITDAIDFMYSLRADHNSEKSPFFVGGLLGPKNDCYRPQEALSRAEAGSYHSWQIERMARTDKLDLILAQTIPSVEEAMGIADAMSNNDIDYVISFVINRSSMVLDSTPLSEAINRIDAAVQRPPAGYMVNCVYPTFLQPEKQPTEFFLRLIGIQANSSSRDHDQLDGSDVLLQDSITDWGSHMLRLNRKYGVKILGGCCGTDDSYLTYLITH